MALIRQGVGYKGGDLLHQLIRLAAVQQAGEAPHVALPCRLTLRLHLRYHSPHGEVLHMSFTV